jgi:hypothetical protein
LEWWDDFIGGGVGALLIGFAVTSVVEEENMAGSGVVGWNPLGIVLVAKLLIGEGSLIVGGRVAPAVEEVSGGTGGFCGGGIMVDNPNFIEGGAGDEDLVEFGMIVDAVEVEPVGCAGVGGIVDVDAVRMIGNDAVVGKGGVEILYEMISGMPLPDDEGVVGAEGLEFDDGFGPEALVDVLGVAPEVDGLAGG